MPPPESGLHGVDLAEHARYVRRLARGLLGDASAADDLAQDTLVRALERPPRDARGLRAWLGTVARRLAINQRRGEGRRGAREEAAARSEAEDGPDAVAERLELAECLAAEVARLREPYRTAIYLRYHEGLAPAAIAERLGVPVKTVRTRLSRALEELRARLDARDGGREAWSALLLPLAFPRGALEVAAPAVPLAAALTGGLVVKKFVVVLAAAVVLGLAWQGLHTFRATSSAGRSTPVVARTALQDVAPAAEGVAVEAASAPRTPLEVTLEPATPSMGDLLATLVWADDGAPAAEACAEVEVLDGRTPRPDRLHVRTDAEGRARFEGLPAGRVRFFPPIGSSSVLTIVAGSTSEERVELDSGSVVEGRVLAPDGAPVGGAEIRVQRYDGRGILGHGVARSGPDGTFRARGLDPGDWLGAVASGWRPSLAFRPGDLPVGARGTREVELTLGEPGERLAGRVVDEDGQPVAGAQVLAGPRGGSNTNLPTGLSGVTAAPALVLTDGDGGFEILGDLDSGWQPVEVVAAGHPVWFGGAELKAGRGTWLEVRLGAGARIAGRVLGVDGTPRAGVRVLASREVGALRLFDRTPVPTVLTDDRGEFLLEWVHPGEVEVHASDPDDADAGRGRARVVCVAGERSEVELTLDAEPAIRGRVVDTDGQPLAGWSVFAKTSGWLQMSPMHPGTMSNLIDYRATDAQGRFVVPNADDHLWTLSVAAPDTAPFPPRAELQGVRAGAAEVEIVVASAAEQPSTLRVRLVDVDGRPPQDVRATLWDEHGTSGFFPEYDASTGLASWSVSMPGRFRVHVQRGERTIHRGEAIDLLPGQAIDLGEIRFGEPGGLSIDVRGPEAGGLEHVDVTVVPVGLDVQLTLERENLTFRAQTVAPGRYVLRVDHEAFFAPEREVEVRPGEIAREEFEIVAAFPVRIALELPDGDPEWHSIEWELLDASGSRIRSGRVRNWGRFEGAAAPGIRGLGLPPGRYTLRAAADTGLRGELALDVSDLLTARGPHVLAFFP